MPDILNEIDEVIARNTARFDPFGGGEAAGHGVDDSMRWRPAGKSGIEEEPASGDVVFEFADRGNLPAAATLDPATGAATWTQNSDRSRPPFTLTPADYVALYGPASLAADVRMMTEAEVAEFDRRQHLSIECGRMGRTLGCGGCDGLALDNFPCQHACHDGLTTQVARCFLCNWQSSGRGDYVVRRARDHVELQHPDRERGVETVRISIEPAVPPVDAALEPDPDARLDVDDIATVTGVPMLPALPPGPPLYCAGCGREITYSGVCTRCPEPAWAAEVRRRLGTDDPLKLRPWWRRMFSGGNR